MGSAELALPALAQTELCRGRGNGLFTQQYHFMAGFDSNTCKSCEKFSPGNLWDFLEEKLDKTDLPELPVTSSPVSS